MGKKLVVLTKAQNADRSQVGPTNAKGADAKAHPGFDLVDADIQALHQGVYIVTPPIVSRQEAAARYIALPVALVWKLQFGFGVIALRHRIGIEIVVQVDTIYVVALEHIQHHGHTVRRRRRLTRVHPQLEIGRAHV